jgi:glutamate dehydrogenase
VKKNVPEQYIKNAIASCLASKLVYKEGTKFMEAQPKHNLARIALEYIAKEKEIALLKEALTNAVMPEMEKEAILKLLDAGGARTALNVF